MAFTPWDKMKSLKILAEIEKKSCPRPEPWLVPSSVEKCEWWIAASKGDWEGAADKEKQEYGSWRPREWALRSAMSDAGVNYC